ncbi:MAG: Gfo/Idh/MocA family protein [Nocardioidaceae bacterium]
MRLLVVGCGDIAESAHLPAIARSGDVELVGLVDPASSNRSRLAAQLDVPDASDLDGGASWGADAVIVATPPEATPSITIDAVRRGLHVLCEKPMAVDLAEAALVHDAAADTDRIVQVGFVNRFSPVTARVRQWIREGRLGHPLLFTLSTYDERYDPANDVHTKRILHFLEHGPAFLHEAAHQTDYVAYLGGGTPVDVVARGLVSDSVFPSENYTCALVRYDNRNVARLEVTWMFPVLPRGDFQIFGPKGSVRVNRAEGWATLQSPAAEDERIELDRPWVEQAFDAQLAAFAEAVRSGQPRGPTTADGLASLSLCHQVVAAMKGAGR